MAKPLPATAPNEDASVRRPPHANAEVHKRIMAHLETMTPEEFLVSLVQAGVCTPDGELTEHYADGKSEDPAGTFRE